MTIQNQELVGPNPNQNYLKSAISKIYRDEDDFIILGLTGRTGSGCSTAAKILQSPREKIRHSLFNGDHPSSHEQRKERILFRHFSAEWTPFSLLQVRALITTFLLDYDTSLVLNIIDRTSLPEDRTTNLINLLEELKDQYLKIKNSVESIDSIEYYTKILPLQCEEIRSILGEGNFVNLYQEIGKNIRLSGNPYDKTLIDGKFFTLAERVKQVVKIIHRENKSKNRKTYIVIDAIRSPLEAIFFQNRFSSFYLVAVSAPEKDRIERLRRLKYSEEDIKSIDSKEYTARDLNETDFFSVQDIQACLQRGDLYISNPDVASLVNEFQKLANQLIRFVSLIRRPGIVTPSPTERCMQIAYTAKLNSGCISRQVGAVVTDANFSLRAIGWNDVPQGQVPCILRSRDDLLGGQDYRAYSEFERTNSKFLASFTKSTEKLSKLDLKGRNNAYCFKSEYNKHTGIENQVHTRSLHAEENAFLQISKYGLASIEGGILFTTASPCELCAKKAYQLGISNIIYIDPYPGIAITHILHGGTKNPKMQIFSGAIGRAFHRLYTPIVAYKDELRALSR